MYVFGKNVALEYLNKKNKINKIFLQNNFNDKEILNKIKKCNIKVEYLSKNDMDKKVSGLNQGIILDVEDYKYKTLNDIINSSDSLVLILDHILDPHNFGAIIRTCEAFGVDAIIVPQDRCVLVNSTVMKTSVGTAEKMKIVKVTNLNNAIKMLKKEGFWIYGTDMEGSNFYNEEKYDAGVAIVIGSEGFGMSRLVKENCDFLIKIPMKGKINSLNASVSAGIVMYEVYNQRRRRI